jgi:NADPH:quinone reductase-like Zn-dependent oxidoreductase
MKAIVQDRYGSADVLEFADVPKPAPKEGELLVRVHAAGVDQGQWHLMAGKPYLIRVMGFGFRAPKARVRGRDLAGTVEAIGPNATGFAVGDEVYGTCDSSFAEYATVPVKQAALKPANLTFEQAAAVPISGGSALQAVRDVAKVRAGQRVLVLGAAGGVGSFAVQLAKAEGAHVTGVCSTSKLDLVRSIGADEVIDYTAQDITGTYDVIIDTGGNRSLSELRKALVPKGILVLVGGETDGPLLGGFDRTIRAGLLSPFVGQQLRGLISTERAEDFDDLRVLIEAGKIAPVIDRTFALAEAAAAIRHLRDGHPRGKIVLAV